MYGNYVLIFFASDGQISHLKLDAILPLVVAQVHIQVTSPVLVGIGGLLSFPEKLSRLPRNVNKVQPGEGLKIFHANQAAKSSLSTGVHGLITETGS